MSLWAAIEELRTKPKAVRNAYAFWIALGVSCCIVVIWVTSLPARMDFLASFTQPHATETATETSTTTSDTTALEPPKLHATPVAAHEKRALFAGLTASVASSFNVVKEQLSRLRAPQTTPVIDDVEPVWQPQTTTKPPVDAHAVLLATTSLATSSQATTTSTTSTENMLQ